MVRRVSKVYEETQKEPVVVYLIPNEFLRSIATMTRSVSAVGGANKEGGVGNLLACYPIRVGRERPLEEVMGLQMLPRMEEGK